MNDDRPTMTFPEEVAEYVEEQYSSANVVLEYGSGGSTVLAAELPALKCFSVESDRKWADNLAKWIGENVPNSCTVIHYANIGPTQDWGWPRNIGRLNTIRFAQYPRSVWRRRDFEHPDIVLIDGRFRVGCFLTTISKIERPVTILFDDYTEREHYRVVEQFATPTQLVGRMAVFEVVPRRLSVKDWIDNARAVLRPT